MNNELLINTLSTILTVITITGLLIFIIYDILKSAKQKEYMESLNEHDKAVITDYKNVKVFKKRK